jgi:mono/diheme cytochrome c family protein
LQRSTTSKLGTLTRQASQDKVDAELLLEILEAAKVGGIDTTALETSLSSGSPHLVAGGDAEAGRRIYEESLSANCTACHRMGPVGSDVGPPLISIGKKGRAYLLESLIDPQARIAEGFPQPSTMPPMGLILNHREIRDLVEFLANRQ